MDSKIDSVIKLNLKAREHSDRSDYKRALQTYIKALNLLTKTKYPKEQEMEAILFNNLGHVYVKTGDLDKALDFFNKSAVLYLGLDDMLGVGQQLGNVGSIYRDKGMRNAALKSYNKSVRAFKLGGNKHGLADRYSDIGYIYSQEEDLEHAIEYFNRAKVLYKELDLMEKARIVDKNISVLSRFYK